MLLGRFAALLILLLFGLPVSLRAGAPPRQSTAQAIEQRVQGYDRISGALTLYRKTIEGHASLLMEVRDDQFGPLFLLQATISRGLGSGIDAITGGQIDDIPFVFRKLGDARLEMIIPDLFHRPGRGAAVRKVLDRSFSEGLLQSFRIDTSGAGRYLIDVTDFFQGDVAGVQGLVSGVDPRMILDRQNSYLDLGGVRGFPENVLVPSVYRFSKPPHAQSLSGPPFHGNQTVADLSSVQVSVSYLVSQLPSGGGYRPRLFDPRVGFGATLFDRYDEGSGLSPKQGYILRWRLEKRDPRATMSEPVKPIVYWIDDSVPALYRSAVTKGILRWNKAIEAIGIKNAIEVRPRPQDADWDPSDLRYNVVRWSVSSPGNGIGLSIFRANPATGEILNASITIDSSILNFFAFTYDNVVRPGTHSANALIPGCGFGSMAAVGVALAMLPGAQSEERRRAFVDEYLSQTICHEMGHSLGLRHNFRGSVYLTLAEMGDAATVAKKGLAASVMDYLPYNIAALDHPGVPFFPESVGPYDRWTIEYGYKPLPASSPEDELPVLKRIASRTNEAGLTLVGDEYVENIDPYTSQGDYGKEPLEFWARTMELSRELLAHLPDRVAKTNAGFWEYTSAFYSLLGAEGKAANQFARFVGAVRFAPNAKGDPGQQPPMRAVDSRIQRRALDLVMKHVFAPGTMSVAPEAQRLLSQDPNRVHGRDPLEEHSVLDTIGAYKTSVLRRLFNADVLDRIVNNAYRSKGSDRPLLLPELFQTVRGQLWKELEKGIGVDPFRRQLQRAYVDLMIDMVTNRKNGAPGDAKMLAWGELRWLSQRLPVAGKKAVDPLSRLHFEELSSRVKRGLAAQQVVGG